MKNLISGRKNLIVFIGIVLTVLLICIVAFGWNWAGRENRLVQAASQLGYTPADEIARVERCWDIFAHCGIFLFYRTNLTVDAFEQMLNTPGWTINYKSEVSGYYIFTEINMHTKDRLTINGSDMLGDRSRLPSIPARQWNLTSRNGGEWTIHYYSLAAQDRNVALNGAPLNANIVSIMYQTK